MKLASSTYLVLGGTRSGKSRYAEQLAIDTDLEKVYIATASVQDEEMRARVAQHKQARKPDNWKTVEEPLALAAVLSQYASSKRVILVDCLTMWLMNLLMLDDDKPLRHEINALLALSGLPGHIIFVSNEIGLGIIPMGELSRRYVDEAGDLHQKLAQKVNKVELIVAGLPQVLKDE
jgi:adenosylcobinamide kinase/adenosylcobinamide-phosphate guanylyltransferase